MNLKNYFFHFHVFRFLKLEIAAQVIVIYRNENETGSIREIWGYLLHVICSSSAPSTPTPRHQNRTLILFSSISNLESPEPTSMKLLNYNNPKERYANELYNN